MPIEFLGTQGFSAHRVSRHAGIDVMAAYFFSFATAIGTSSSSESQKLGPWGSQPKFVARTESARLFDPQR